MSDSDTLERKVTAMEGRLRVIRVDRMGARARMDEEAEELAGVKAELVGVDCATEDEIIESARDADVILTNAAHMTRRVMEGLPKCRAIIRYGIGYDTIDVEAATDNGICIVNIPDFCFEEVSNHAIALLLACAKKLVMLNNRIKEGGWGEAMRVMAPMVSIHGQTLGIIGCGNIGRMTARKAACFSLRVIGYDPYVEKSLAEDSGISLVSLPDLLKESDFISVHTPLDKETRHLIGENEF
ncbi:NAD(P)-dependent oxidoreductase, partial [Chloroflexota bacterium]